MFSSLQNFKLPIMLISPVLTMASFQGYLPKRTFSPSKPSDTQMKEVVAGCVRITSAAPKNNQLKAVCQTEMSSVQVYVEVDKLEHGQNDNHFYKKRVQCYNEYIFSEVSLLFNIFQIWS